MNEAQITPSAEIIRAFPAKAPAPPPEQALKSGGGGGNYIGMEPATREYVDLKLEAALSRLEGKFDLLNQRMSDLEKRMPSWWSILGAVMIGVATVLAALAFAGDRFDGGISLADQRQEQLERDRQQDETLRRLDEIITRLNAPSASPSTAATPEPSR